MITVATAALVVLLGSAQAKDGPTLQDRGVDIPDPYDYQLNAANTPPPFEGFRELYVDAEAFRAKLAPVAPPALPKVDVPVPPGATGMPVVVPNPGQPPAVVGDLPVVRPGPMVPPQGNLIVANESNGWAKVSLNGTLVGLVPPLAFAVLHQIPSGGYDVAMETTSGFTTTRRLQTCGVCKVADWRPDW